MAKPGDIRRARLKAIGGKRDRCRKGKSCSAACVARWKECLAEMPVPVQSSLAKAVKAIQGRKERVGTREKRQSSQERRDQVKGRLKENAKLREQRSSFVKKRNSLRIEIQRGIVAEEHTKVNELRGKLKLMEDKIGSKLGVPKSKPITSEETNARLAEARKSFRKGLNRLHDKLKVAAGSDPNIKPNKKLYEELEKKLMGYIGRKEIGPLWKGYEMMNSRSYYSRYDKGRLWRQMANDREMERTSKLRGVYRNLVTEASKAAEDGNSKKYREVESKLLKISERTGDRLGLREKPTKGSLWKDVRVPIALKSLTDSIDKALASGDLNRYNKLEDKFLKVRNAYVAGGGYARNDKLYTSNGYRALAQKGQLLKEYVDSLKSETRRAAESKNRREYERLEKNLLRLSPEEKKGSIWKSAVERRVQEYIPALKGKMRLAIAAGNRKEYNRLERVLMRLDPNEKKGGMWMEGRIRNYKPILEGKLRQAAADGNRKEYNKLERILFRLDPSKANTKGEVWLKERVNTAVDKLKGEMDKAIAANDRAKYDKLEAKFLKIRDKVGWSAIYDQDLRFVGRGELWQGAKNKTMIPELESSLNVGKREGVGKISIYESGSGFDVRSKVLGNVLELSIMPNDSTSFMVNGSYQATENLTKREKIAIIREVTRQYTGVMGKMEDDTVFKVSAASGDGRQDMRVKAYVGYGFSDPNSSGYMYGVVRGGKVQASDEDEYYDLR